MRALRPAPAFTVAVVVLLDFATAAWGVDCNSPCVVEETGGDPVVKLKDLDGDATFWELGSKNNGEVFEIWPFFSYQSEPAPPFKIHEDARENQIVLDANGNTAFNGTLTDPSHDVEIFAPDTRFEDFVALALSADGDHARLRVNAAVDTFAIALKNSSGNPTYDKSFVMHLDAGPNSLTIDEGGDVGVGGIGVDNILGNFHVVGGQVYLDPDGTAGDWQLSAGASGLWFQNEDGSLTSPLKVQNRAPDNQLVVDVSGIGIGTDLPSEDLDIVSGSPTIALTDVDVFSGAVNGIWEINSDPQAAIFDIRDVTGGVSPLMIDSGALDAAVVIDAAGVSLSSSRTVKRDIEPAVPAALLAQLAELPIYTWSYAGDGSGALHLGPMAEDFHRLFGLGKSARRISSIDTAGVALAAIQALHRELAKRDSEIAELRQMVERLLWARGADSPLDRRSGAVVY